MKWICKNGHEFQSKANLRAHCPECGELVKKFDRPKLDPKASKQSGGQSSESNQNSNEQTGGDQNSTKGKNGGEKTRDQTTTNSGSTENQEKHKSYRPRRLRVKRKPHSEKITKKLVRRRKIHKKQSAPAITKIVKTNKEKQEEKTRGKNKGSMWSQVRKSGFF